MNRDETSKLLEILVGNYNKKVTDPATMVETWELALGCFSAEAVYKAARLHMETSKYFPNPADIREKIVRASLIYQAPTAAAIGAGDTGADWEPFINAFCRKVGFDGPPEEELDLRQYLPEGAQMPPFLTYEY